MHMNLKSIKANQLSKRQEFDATATSNCAPNIADFAVLTTLGGQINRVATEVALYTEAHSTSQFILKDRAEAVHRCINLPIASAVLARSLSEQIHQLACCTGPLQL